MHTNRSVLIQKHYRASRDRAHAQIAGEVRRLLREAILVNDIPSLEAALKHAHEESIQVFELVLAGKSLQRLYDEQRVKQLLAEALALDPLQEHEALRHAIAEADKMHLDPLYELLSTAKRVYASIRERVEVITALREGVASADEGVLLQGLALASALFPQWGHFCEKDSKAAHDTLQAISREKDMLASLREVVKEGSPSFDDDDDAAEGGGGKGGGGGGGNLVVSSAQIAALERKLRAVETHGVLTHDGKRLIKETHLVIDIRQSLHAEMWGRLESLLHEHEQLCTLGGGAREESTMADLRVAREELIHRVVAPKLMNGLKKGETKGRVGHLEINPMGVTLLEECFKVLCYNPHPQPSILYPIPSTLNPQP